MSENIITVKLKESFSKNVFFLVLGEGTFELKSFNMAGHLTSDLVPGTRPTMISKDQMPGGCPGGGGRGGGGGKMLEFQVD